MSQDILRAACWQLLHIIIMKYPWHGIMRKLSGCIICGKPTAKLGIVPFPPLARKMNTVWLGL